MVCIAPQQAQGEGIMESDVFSLSKHRTISVQMFSLRFFRRPFLAIANCNGNNVMQLRVIVVDDERLARLELCSMLEEYDDIAIVGEADSVEAALKVIEEVAPAVVFLDIQMPGKSGFELLSQIDVSIQVVFVTAFDQYAMRAFEVNAVDYLLKPVSFERLQRSIDRLHGYKHSEHLIRGHVPLRFTAEDRLLVHIGKNREFVPIDDVRFIRASDKYSEIIADRERIYLTYDSLQTWTERLPENFVRIHRSFIVNVHHIERIVDDVNGRKLVYLQGTEEPFIMSRRYGVQFRYRVKLLPFG